MPFLFMTSMYRSVVISLLLLLVTFGRRDAGVEGLAIKQTYYVKNTCEVEMSSTLLFGAIGVDETGNVAIGECLDGTYPVNLWSAADRSMIPCFDIPVGPFRSSLVPLGVRLHHKLTTIATTSYVQSARYPPTRVLSYLPAGDPKDIRQDRISFGTILQCCTY